MRTEDGYLIHKCLNGEKEAFGFLVDKYKTSVYAFAYSLLWNFHEALDSLPEMYRQVLTLYYIGGMSGKEIAQFLGTSPSNIRQRLNRARAKLKKEMLDMMSKTYEQHKLQPSFTFRIVEMVKQIKIQPAPRSTPLLPLGLSAATGIILTALMFSSHLISLTPLGALLGSPMPGETKVMEEGELPVDVLEISEITFLSSEQGDGKYRAKKLPNQQNAFAPPLAPSGEGTWTKKVDMPTARWGFSTSAVKSKIYAIGGSMAAPQGRGISIVEEYDTGFAGQSIDTEGKLPMTWGRMKAER